MNRKSLGIQAFLLGASIVLTTAALAGDATIQEVDRSKVCMMEDQVQPRAGIPHVYQGKTYYLCCQMCVDTFESDAERYSKATDPVSGRRVDKATAPVLGYQGRAYFFESDETRAAFAKEPARYLGSQRQS